MKTKSVTLKKIKKRFSIIKTQISQIVENKYVYDKFRKYLKDNNITDMDRSGDFLRFVVNNYIGMAIVNVCKQIDENRQSESLINLLKDIKFNSNLIRQEWYLENDKDFKDFFNKITKRAKKTKIEVDIRKLRQDIGKSSKRFRDSLLKLRHKQTAHYDKGNFQSFQVFEDLNNAIVTLEKNVFKYDGLINGVLQPDGLVDMNIDDYIKFGTLFRSNI